jgi:hypothetical protein
MMDPTELWGLALGRPTQRWFVAPCPRARARKTQARTLAVAPKEEEASPTSGLGLHQYTRGLFNGGMGGGGGSPRIFQMQ